MIKRNLLLIIDMQNDFCLQKGALYVQGGEKDVQRLSSFIKNNEERIDNIILTQDTHHIIDISHPGFWADENDNAPTPFTEISIEDINNNYWRPKFHKEEAVNYVNQLNRQNEFPHVIWPEHCIVGSSGAAISDELMNAIKSWARRGHFFTIIQKGLNPLTEHFGALRANIPLASDVGTQLNQVLVNELMLYENIIIAGEAKSHCVANTIKQMCEINGLAKKILLLDDTMSNVSGFDDIATPIYNEAKKAGAVITNTNDLTLK